MVEQLERHLRMISNKAKYIQENLTGTIDLRNKHKKEIIHLLNEKLYHAIDGDDEFKYLLKMPMDSVSSENIDKLLKEKGNKETELYDIQQTTIQQFW